MRTEKSADGGAVAALGRYVQWRAPACVSRIDVSSMLYQDVDKLNAHAHDTRTRIRRGRGYER